MASAAYRDAYALYTYQFPDLASLGEDAATWKAELDKVTPDAFDAVSARSLNVEGGNMSGVGNFEAMYRVRALHARRAVLDVTYVNPYTVEPPGEPFVRIGAVVSLQGGC
jgi:hypothetical protein